MRVLIRLSVLLHIQCRGLLSLSILISKRVENSGNTYTFAFCITIAIYLLLRMCAQGLRVALVFRGRSSRCVPVQLGFGLDSDGRGLQRSFKCAIGSPRPGAEKRNLCDATIFILSGLCEHATSFLFRVCRISTSVLWHYSAIRRNGRVRD